MDWKGYEHISQKTRFIFEAIIKTFKLKLDDTIWYSDTETLLDYIEWCINNK